MHLLSFCSWTFVRLEDIRRLYKLTRTHAYAWIHLAHVVREHTHKLKNRNRTTYENKNKTEKAKQTQWAIEFQSEHFLSLSLISLEGLLFCIILAMKCIRNSVILFDFNNISPIFELLFDASLASGLNHSIFKIYNSTNTMGDALNSICVPIFFYVDKTDWLSYESENLTVGTFTFFMCFSLKK